MKRKVVQFAVLFLVFVVLLGFLQYMRFGGILGFVIVTEGPSEGQTTLMLQTAGSDNLGDTYVAGDLANTNFNNKDYLLVKWGSPKRNAYLNFNLSAIPSGKVIDSASLCLYIYDDQGTQTIGAHQVYNSFDETTLTWNNQPCGTAFDNSTNCNLTADSSVSTDGSLDGAWMCWNVLNSVSQEYNSLSNNATFVLHTSDEGYADNFYTKEYSNASLTPYLNITYSAIISNSAPAINIVSPVYNENLSYNSSIGLNFTISDTDENLDSCWYNLNDSTNLTISNCGNISFNLGNGNYNINLYANDSLNAVGFDSVSFFVNVSLNVSGNESAGNETEDLGNETIVPEEIPSSGSSSSSGGGGGGGGRSDFIITPNNSIPEKENILEASSEAQTEFNSEEDNEAVVPAKGVTGFALFVSENKKTLSIIGTIVMSVLALVFAARFIYLHHRKVSGFDRKKKQLIDVSFDGE